MKADTPDQNKERPKGAEQSNPVARFESTGSVLVAVWHRTNADGESEYTVTIENSHSNTEGKPQMSNPLAKDDLLKLARLIQLADTWIDSEIDRKSSEEKFTDRIKQSLPHSNTNYRCP